MAVTREVEGLKPCPFCGYTLFRIRVSTVVVAVSCRRCNCIGPVVIVRPDDTEADRADAEAIAAWNERVT